MEIPLLGKLTKDIKFGWYCSDPIAVPVLGGKMCRFVFEGYEEDQKKDDFHAAIANFLSIDESALHAAAPFVYQYYKDCIGYWDSGDENCVEIESVEAVWNHVKFGSEPMISRRSYRDEEIYISLECECDWEQEHGLQIVFKNGLKINKVGPFDGHLTNSDAYGDDRLENLIYRQRQ